jgi:branched-chain amino acid transport system substrate-binding protein
MTKIKFRPGWSAVFVLLAAVLVVSPVWAGGGQPDKPAEVRIGSLLVLSGQYKSFGDMVKKGIDVAEKRIAEKGPAPLRMYVYDHQYDKSVVEEKLALLKIKGVHYIADIMGSGLCENALPAVERNDMIVLSAVNTSTAFTYSGDKRFFRVVPSDGIAAAQASSWALGLGLKQAVVVFNNTEWGQQLAQVFEKEFQDAGGKVVFSEPVAEDQILFAPLVNKIKPYKDAVIFLAVSPSQAGLIVKESHKQEIANSFLGTDNFTAEEIITTGGNTLAGVRYVIPVQKAERTAERESFDSLYKDAFGDETPHIFTVYIYDVVNILYNVALKAGDDTAKAIEMLESLDYQGASGRIRFDKNHDVLVSDYQHMIFKDEGGSIIRSPADE